MPDFYNYNTQTERRSLLTTEDAGTWKLVDGLIPYTVYYVQINASNTAGYLLSNVKQAIMPQGGKLVCMCVYVCVRVCVCVCVCTNIYRLQDVKTIHSDNREISNHCVISVFKLFWFGAALYMLKEIKSYPLS